MVNAGLIFGLVTAVLVLLALSRILFVNIHVTWDGQPISWLIRFVPIRSGKRLARAFLEMSDHT
jgi:hypothetical protein